MGNGRSRGLLVFILVYFDDILFVGDRAAIQRVKERLGSRFTATDIGACTHFLGVKIDRVRNSLFISQQFITATVIALTVTINSKAFNGPPFPLTSTI